jgi:polar amino acid transport system substrate-binding protein
MNRSTRTTLVLCAASVVIVGLSACAPDISSASGASSTAPAAAASGCAIAGHDVAADASLHKALPTAIRNSGTLTIATAGDTPPYTYKDSAGELTGLEVNMARAVACKLGVKVDFKTIAFAGILTGIQAGRYDMGMSTISDTSEREKVMNFVSYQTEGTAIVVPKGNANGVKDLSGLCGETVAVTQGSISEQLVQKQSAACSKSITAVPLPTEADGYLAVRSGRAEAFLDTYGAAVYTSEHGSGTGKQLQVVPGKRYGIGYQAVALPKTTDGTRLTKTVAKAFDKLISEGTYGALYKKQGLTQNELKKVAINDAAKYESHFLDIN